MPLGIIDTPETQTGSDNAGGGIPPIPPGEMGDYGDYDRWDSELAEAFWQQFRWEFSETEPASFEVGRVAANSYLEYPDSQVSYHDGHPMTGGVDQMISSDSEVRLTKELLDKPMPKAKVIGFASLNATHDGPLADVIQLFPDKPTYYPPRYQF